MIIAKILLVIASVFAALSLCCAVTIGRRAPPQSGHFGGPSPGAKRASSAPADPYSEPFGDAPEPCGFARSSTGFTTEQLCQVAPPVVTADPLRRSFAKPSGPALRPDAGSGGPFPSGRAAARNPFRSWRGRAS